MLCVSVTMTVLPFAIAAAAQPELHRSTGGADSVAMPSCSSSTSISYGAVPKRVSISKDGAIACLTFHGSDGDVEFTDIAVTSGDISPFFDIFSPSDTSTCAGPYSQPTLCTVDASGTWTIEVSDSENDETGSMNVAIQKLDSAAGCASISYGPKVTKGKVKTPAAITCYKFSQSAGQVVYIRDVGIKGSIGTPDMLLAAPDGSEPCGNGAGTLECSIGESGTQSLLLYSTEGDTGSFDVSDQRLTSPVDCPKITKGGAAASSEISTIGEVQCFEFKGKDKEKVTVSLADVTGTLDPLMDLFNPSGNSVLAGPTTSLSYTLTAKGTWVVLVEDSSGKGLGDFEISLT